MAEKLDDFEFGTGHGNAKYPWDDWTDGSIYKIQRGVDFDSSVEGMRTGIYAHARKLGLGVRVSRRNGADSLVFQFSKPLTK